RVLIEGLRSILKTHGPMMFTIKGQSMKPTLQNGDMVAVSWVDHDHLQTGDIVLAILTNGQEIQMLAHRVVEVREQGQSRLVILKGDSRERPEPPIPLEWIVGRVEQKSSDKGHEEEKPK
ncbi:MAG TPA: signal peptidase I, partial [Anaerolineae bacterium]|nr:signal peptidase I [Anaerolineae bacterium]